MSSICHIHRPVCCLLCVCSLLFLLCKVWWAGAASGWYAFPSSRSSSEHTRHVLDLRIWEILLSGGIIRARGCTIKDVYGTILIRGRTAGEGGKNGRHDRYGPEDSRALQCYTTNFFIKTHHLSGEDKVMDRAQLSPTQQLQRWSHSSGDFSSNPIIIHNQRLLFWFQYSTFISSHKSWCKKTFEFYIKTSFYCLWNISKIHLILSLSDTKKLLHAFVYSRLYCLNTLFSGIPTKSLKRLQYIPNPTARILMIVHKHDHITSILHSCNWFPISTRLEFLVEIQSIKISLLT